MKKIYFRILLSVVTLIALSLGPMWSYAFQKNLNSAHEEHKGEKSILESASKKPSESPKPSETGIGELKLVLASVSSLAHNLFNAGESTQTRNGDVPSAMTNNESDKTLSNVKIYPVPITTSEPLNISCHLSKDTEVTVKLMGIINNEIAVLLPTSRASAGEWTGSFSLPSGLESGMFYFIQVTAGREVNVKRISIK